MSAPLSPALTGTRIEAEYRAAALALRRVDPSAPAFERGAYDPRSVTRARALWSDRMIDEYTSTTVFAQLAAQLVEAGATLDTTAVALRMGHDEAVHAEVCGRVVEAMGGVAWRDRRPVTLIARHAGCSPEERALRNVIFTTCLSEMNSVAYFVAALDVMEDPFLRGVTRQLLSDEVLHGSFGFAYLEAWAPYLDAHPEVRDSIARYLGYAFAVLEATFTRGNEALELSADDLRLGVVHPALASEGFRRTMAEAAVPGLERFGIAAEAAWKRRSLG